MQLTLLQKDISNMGTYTFIQLIYAYASLHKKISKKKSSPKYLQKQEVLCTQ